MTQLFDNPAIEAFHRFAKVAPEQGVDLGASGLTYGIPGELQDIAVGERVLVPLGRSNKRVSGYVIEVLAESDVRADKVKAILGRDVQGISLTPDLIGLARWMASYYCCPLGMVLQTMLPAAVKHGTGRVDQTMVAIADAPPTEGVKLTKLQSAAVDIAAGRAKSDEPWLELRELADMAGARSIAPVKVLIDKGLLKTSQSTTIRAGWAADADAEPVKADALELNASQARVLKHMADTVHTGFGVHLIHGVTGSGKTEVYLRIIEHIRTEAGSAKTAIILVPEISLTPQTAARFTARFDNVAVLHSGLTAAQRHEQWRRIRRGESRIVVGARSAIFAPMPEVGIIIVDEEHESSYKQDQLPRYQARDVAVKRGQLLNCPVVLGSATPSLESYYNATVRNSYHLLRLPERVAGLQLPKVQIVDLVEERRHRRGVHLISRRLEDLLAYTLRQQGQAMLLLNRRGYANYIACPDHNCGWIMGCEHCDATVVYHKSAALPTGGYVSCHHCGAEQLLPNLCPMCGKKVTLFGLGTQRVEEELARKFPNLRMLRMDSDTMRARGEYVKTLDRFRRGEVDVLLGTQMIAKGLDFPNVRLVGVISGDTALQMPDFRAAERTFQLIAQVAGRAGRGDKPGIVIVQTFLPNDQTIQFATKHDYEGFAAKEMKLREEVALPPFSRMARIVVRDRDSDKCMIHANTLAGQLQQFNQELGSRVRLRGPYACAISRIAGYHRQFIEMLAPPPDPAATLQKLLTALRNARLLVSDAHTAIDVDPVDLF